MREPAMAAGIREGSGDTSYVCAGQRSKSAGVGVAGGHVHAPANCQQTSTWGGGSERGCVCTAPLHPRVPDHPPGIHRFVPGLHQRVHVFEWSHPETGKAAGWCFSTVNFKASQSLRLRVLEVPIDDRKYDIELFMAYTVRRHSCFLRGKGVRGEREAIPVGVFGLLSRCSWPTWCAGLYRRGCHRWDGWAVEHCRAIHGLHDSRAQAVNCGNLYLTPFGQGCGSPPLYPPISGL